MSTCPAAYIYYDGKWYGMYTDNSIKMIKKVSTFDTEHEACMHIADRILKIREHEVKVLERARQRAMQAEKTKTSE